MKRAAMYLRVSSPVQSVEAQRDELVALAATRGLDVVEVYEEIRSAAKRRPVYDRMMKDSRRRHFDVLLVWSLDRLGRNLGETFIAVTELDGLGVELVSIREPWLAMGGPTRGLLIAVFSWAAEQERARLIERVQAGIEARRRRGQAIGRPRVWVDTGRARELLLRGLSERQVARKLRVARRTLSRALAGVAQKPALPEAQASSVETRPEVS